MVFDGEGVVTQLVYASRKLRKSRDLEVLSLQAADNLALSALGLDKLDEGFSSQALNLQSDGSRCLNTQQNSLCLSSEVVYYAPELEKDVKEIFPHYLYSATLTIDGEALSARRVLIPAVEAAPSVNLTASFSRGEVQAEATVRGGLAPYHYEWFSSTAELPFKPTLASAIMQTLEWIAAKP
ncbi:MAG: hypothetical protein R2880_04620 [Deinococcales bacterium]